MSFFVICTFDLARASREDYQAAYSDLESIGLYGVAVSDNQQKIVMPTTTTAGHFTGNSAIAVRDYVASAVQQAFRARGFSSEIFVVVNNDEIWSARTT